jgi:hypothetical protein
MWDEVKSLNSKKIISSITRRHVTKGNGIESKMPQKGKGPNISKARGSNPKAILSRKGFPSKGANPKGHTSIAMKWDIIPKITPNLNQGMEAQK